MDPNAQRWTLQESKVFANVCCVLAIVDLNMRQLKLILSIGYHGGILTNARKDNSDPEQQSISHCLHPGDLLPFTRKPMFLIVDSNNSVAFAVIRF
jgi:hypothetical protein